MTTNDRTWKYFANGPVVYGSLDFGEVYDTTREPAVEGWATAAYNDARGSRAVGRAPRGHDVRRGGRVGRGGARDEDHVRQAVAHRPDWRHAGSSAR